MTSTRLFMCAFPGRKETTDMRTHMDGVQHGHTCDRTNAGGKEQLDTVSIRHPGQTGRNYPPGRCTAAFDELAVDNAADYLTRGLITIKGQYATENFSEYSHPLKETYFNK